MKNSILLVIDVQNDFCPGGKLAVNEGDKVIGPINKMMQMFDIVIATQDWHPENHSSFASNHPGHSPMEIVEHAGIQQVLWPEHCVQGTKGAEFHPELNLNPIVSIIRKGTRAELDSYSAFLENDKSTPTGLEGMLRSLEVTDIYLCGLATDYCVYYSAEDAIKAGFNVFLVKDACRGVDFPEGSIEKALNSISDQNGTILTSGEILT